MVVVRLVAGVDADPQLVGFDPVGDLTLDSRPLSVDKHLLLANHAKVFAGRVV